MKTILIIFLITLYFTLSQQKNQYNPTFARSTLDFATAAYCAGPKGKGVNDWSCQQCRQHPGVTAKEFYNQVTEQIGFVAYDPTQNMISVSFAGTDPRSIQNIIQDLRANLQNYSECEGCLVHTGWITSLQSVWSQVRDLVKQFSQQHQGAQLMVTGHSLGASVGVLAAIEIQKLGIQVDYVYTYGQPRIGNAALANFITSQPFSYFRITHAADPVPHYPSQVFGYLHAYPEIFYPGQDLNYQQCNESQSQQCADSVKMPIDIFDHNEYLQVSLTSAQAACRGY